MSESVWDYPRPPRLEPCARRVRVRLGGEVIADSVSALRVLETSHPPTIYVPPGDVAAGRLRPSSRPRSLCEWKGRARYWDVAGEAAAAWSYPNPVERYAALRDHLCFYPSRFECLLDDEPVKAQEGDFYGGWITSDIAGPYKGPPGTAFW